MSKEAEAAAAKWFMFTLLPTYKDALESITAGCLPGVNSSMNAKVNSIKHSVHCIPAIYASFQAQGPYCCRQGGDVLQDTPLLQAICDLKVHHVMHAFKAGRDSAGSGMVRAWDA